MTGSLAKLAVHMKRHKDIIVLIELLKMAAEQWPHVN